MQELREKHTKQLRKFNALGPCANVVVAANTGSWRLERPQINFDACVKCGICVTFCPCGAMTVDKAKQQCVTIDWRYCKGCGICANQCHKKCIDMVAEGGGKSGSL